MTLASALLLAFLARAEAASFGPPVHLIGIDGATWDLLDPLLARGRMPNLKRLMSDGCHATLWSDDPRMSSAVIWTSIATGKRSAKHGIRDWDMVNGPPPSSRRKVKALWNILSEAGARVLLSYYMGAWPAEPVLGVNVTKRFSGGEDVPRAFYPADAFKPYEAALAREVLADWPRSESGPRAAPASEQASEEARAITLAQALASDEAAVRVAEFFLPDGAFDFFAVHLWGLDWVSHQHLSTRDQDLRSVVDAYYEHVDRLLGRLLAARKGATVLVASDHGFRAKRPALRKSRGRWVTPGEHTGRGILVVSGPRAGRCAARGRAATLRRRAHRASPDGLARRPGHGRPSAVSFFGRELHPRRAFPERGQLRGRLSPGDLRRELARRSADDRASSQIGVHQMTAVLLARLALACAASAAGPIRIELGPIPAGPDYDHAAFIDAQAAVLRARGAGDAAGLARALGISDMLEQRSQAALRVHATGESVADGVRRATLRLSSPLGVAQAFLLRPERARGRLPAIVVLPGASQGALHAREQLGAALAKAGHVVLISEPAPGRDFGWEFDDAFNLLLVGRTLAGVRVYGAVLLLDYLESLAFVDPARLAVLGLGSASQSALWTAHLDGRVKALLVDSVLRGEPYYDWAAELMAPGVLEFSRPFSPTFTAPQGYPNPKEPAAWLARAFRGKAPAAQTRAAGSAERLLTLYKGFPPGGPKDVFHYDLAMRYRARGRYPEAIAELRRAAALNPQARYLSKNLAELHRLAGRPDLAERELKAMLAAAVDPGHELSDRLELARLYEERGEEQKALAQYLEALRVNPGAVEPRHALAGLYERRGDFHAAREQYQELIKRDPRRMSARVTLARLLRDDGQAPAAIEELLEAVGLEPVSLEARAALAELYEAQGRWREARGEYERLLATAPAAADARLGLARALAHDGRQKQAAEVLRALASDAPEALARARRRPENRVLETLLP